MTLPTQTLEELAAAPIVYGILQPGPEVEDGVPYVRPTEIRQHSIVLREIRRTARAIAANYTRSSIRADDVLFSIVGTIGKTALVPPELDGGNITQSSVRIRPNPERVDPRYLQYALRSPALTSQFDELRLGTAIPRLNVAQVRALKIPIQSLDIQRRIVEKLDAALEQTRVAREKLEAIPSLVERYRQSVLAAAFRGDLTRAWREEHPDVEPAAKLLERIRAERRAKWDAVELAKMKAKGKAPKDDSWKAKYVESEPVDTKGLPELPESWCWATLGEVCTIKGGITLGKKRDSQTRLRTVPYLRVANVQRGHIDLSEMKEIAATEDEIAELRLIPGDVLFNEGGDRDKLGRGWIWEGQLGECIHQNHVFRARPLTAEVRPTLLSHFGNSFGQRYFLDSGKQTTNLASINLRQLSRLPVALAPAAEQVALEAKLSAMIQKAAELVEPSIQSLEHVGALERATLAKAFHGKLVD